MKVIQNRNSQDQFYALLVVVLSVDVVFTLSLKVKFDNLYTDSQNNQEIKLIKNFKEK